MEDTFKFKHKGNRIQFEFSQQILQMFGNLSAALNNVDTSKAKDLCDYLTAKLKRRNKLIKMADRSVLGCDTVVDYEADPMASDSCDGKKIKQAKNRAWSSSSNVRSGDTCIGCGEIGYWRKYWPSSRHRNYSRRYKK